MLRFITTAVAILHLQGCWVTTAVVVEYKPYPVMCMKKTYPKPPGYADLQALADSGNTPAIDALLWIYTRKLEDYLRTSWIYCRQELLKVREHPDMLVGKQSHGGLELVDH